MCNLTPIQTFTGIGIATMVIAVLSYVFTKREINRDGPPKHLHNRQVREMLDKHNGGE